MKTGNIPGLPGQVTQSAFTVQNQRFWSLGRVWLPVCQVVTFQKATDIETCSLIGRFTLLKSLVV